MLAHLEDTIFEGLPNAKAQAWPERFLDAIKVGSDLSLVGWQFLHWLLTDARANPGITHLLVRDQIRECAAVLEPLTRGEPADYQRARKAADAAWAAGWVAEDASWAPDEATDAAWAAAYATYATYSTKSASAVSAAKAAEAVTWSTPTACTMMADRLIALIEAATPIATQTKRNWRTRIWAALTSHRARRI
jgi:hypothetical protein